MLDGLMAWRLLVRLAAILKEVLASAQSGGKLAVPTANASADSALASARGSFSERATNVIPRLPRQRQTPAAARGPSICFLVYQPFVHQLRSWSNLSFSSCQVTQCVVLEDPAPISAAASSYAGFATLHSSCDGCAANEPVRICSR